MKNSILILFLIFISLSSYSQKKKLPKGVELIEGEYKKCTVCKVQEITSNKDTLIYYYDAIAQKEVTPKKAKLFTHTTYGAGIPNCIFYYENGKTGMVYFKTQYIYKKKNHIVESYITSPTFVNSEVKRVAHDDPHNNRFYNNKFLILETTNFKENLYVVYDKINHKLLGDKFFLSNPYGYRLETSQYAKNENSILFRKLPGNYYQILLPDLTFYPNIEKYPESLGLRIFSNKPYKIERLSNVAIEVFNINNKTLFKPISLYSWIRLNADPIIDLRQITNSVYNNYERFSSYYKRQYGIGVTYLLHETFLLGDSSEYIMIGPDDHQVYPNLGFREDMISYVWATSPNKNDVIAETQIKWEDIDKSNKADLQRKAEMAVKKMKEEEAAKKLKEQQNQQAYNQACADWKTCVDNRKGWTYCEKHVKNIHLLSYDVKKRLNAGVELVVERERKAEQYSKNKNYSNGGSSYIDQQMKRDGYRKMRWNSSSGKWEYE